MLSISAFKDADGPLKLKKNENLVVTRKKYTKSSLPSCYVHECMLLTQHYAI